MGTLLVAAGAMTPALAGEAPAVQRGGFTALVVVKADGSMELGEIDGAEGPVVAVIRRKLAALRYLPAVRDGVAVTTASRLSGTVVLTPVDGQFDVSLADVSLAPRMVKGTVPDYPVDRCRADDSGAAEVMVRIGPEGQVLDAQTVSTTHTDFGRAAKSVAKRWRFEPLPPGEAWTEIAVPLLFYTGRPRMKVPPFQCAAERRARVDGELRCLDRFEVMCSRVPTGDKPGTP